MSKKPVSEPRQWRGVATLEEKSNLLRDPRNFLLRDEVLVANALAHSEVIFPAIGNDIEEPATGAAGPAGRSRTWSEFPGSRNARGRRARGSCRSCLPRMGRVPGGFPALPENPPSANLIDLDAEGVRIDLKVESPATSQIQRLFSSRD